MEAQFADIRLAVLTEIRCAHPELCVEQIDFRRGIESLDSDPRDVWRLAVSGSGEALVAAGVVHGSALDDLPPTRSVVRDDRLIVRLSTGYRVLLLMENAETLLAPYTWHAIQRRRAQA